MGKRSNFERNARDFYATPQKAVEPLRSLIAGSRFIEPCAGDGRFKDFFPNECIFMSDIAPQGTRNDIKQFDVFGYTKEIVNQHDMIDYFVTNPPFLNSKESGWQLNRMILHLASIRPTWLLLPFDYACNKKSYDCMIQCQYIIPIGRVQWIEGSGISSTDNYAWFKFVDKPVDTIFIERGPH